ncbi:transglycosylase domain-containing protein [Dactylosporangium sp. AC04546]|uniref:transglycosylase domain-containing protein n=1 Tax=Dactylosporangium sp. AC04546 TaxID=2862460 RepID=UPI001EDEC021|nr:transglycosylase domain-containing protein [Dactylosporangium sp. AC04546]WVK82590.1 transglycosylase domain-containing protein [Dactylosporangium sp. AC04546]
MITRTLRVFGGLLRLLRTGLVAGLAVAALVYPIVALTGIGAKKGADALITPAGALRASTPAQTTRVYAADNGGLLAQFYEEYRTYVPLAEMSDSIQKAIVAAEDARFWEHHGVDFKGVARAFVANQKAGSVSQGASTLTMQYVRNVLRDTAVTPEEVNRATEQTGARKLREMRLAIELEKHLSKQEILERYLNVAYFGHRAYGVRAAAEVYFSKLPADLTVPEAALLAGLVQAPSAYDPASAEPRAATARRDYVIGRMAALGYLTPALADEARATPIALRLTEPPNDCLATRPGWGFFCAWFRTWWSQQAAFGDSPGERLDALRRGGYTVVTSLDPRVQQIAQQQVLKRERTRSPYALGQVLIEPATGLVRAMAVNRVYSLDRASNGPHSDPRQRKRLHGNYPNTVNPLLGGGDMAGYQAGSTFKMFTMLAALEQGLPLSTTIYSPKTFQSKYKTGRDSPARCGADSWCPSNASDSMTGRQTMYSGFGKSVNTFFVQLEQRVGAESAVRMAERLGLRWRTGIDKLQASEAKARTWGAFTLGVADTTPLEMAGAFATVVADGRHCEPIPVTSITDPSGAEVLDAKGVPVARPRCAQVLSPDVARGAVDAARCVTGYKAATGNCGGWSTASRVYPTVRRPVAGKSGTTDDNRAAWFVGMTPTLTAAAFIADPDNPLHRVGSGNASKPRETVADTLREALAGTQVRDFVPPSAAVAGKPARPRPARH